MKKISILGSCVTRDAFDFNGFLYQIDNYIARTSLISLTSKPIQILEENIPLPSKFQRRCLYQDFNKTFFQEIHAKKSDWIVIDFIDERFNILQFEDSYITKSNELVDSGLHAEKKYTEIQRTEALLPMWKKSAQIFFHKLFKIYMPHQVILHKTHWRHQYYSSNGDIHSFENIKDGIDKKNSMLNNYYDYIQELYPDINIIDMTKETYFCSEKHKWGLSPYHFEKKYYLNFIRSLDQITIQWTPNYKRHKTNFGDVNIMLEYDSSLTYLDFTTSSNIVESKTLKFDREGIPLIKLGSNGQYGFQYYPITIAIYGLECISKYYKTGIDSYRKSFIKICEYFVEKQESNGIWYSEFDYHYGVRECGSCKAPWASALAQGLAISCLVRAYYLTKNTNYILSAKKAINCFFIDIEKGGVRRILFNEYIFFEEYPTEKPSHILNGFMFSLLSLYELYITTKEKEICELYKQGIHTLIQTVSMYDLGNVSSYDLTHITIPGNPSKYHYQYHLTHVHLLSAINLIEQNSILEKVLHRWLTYAQGNKSCFRLEENNIKIIINEVEENKLMLKNQENSVRIEYDLNEELDYAFYINNDDKRILTKKYNKNNSIKFTPIENNYTIIAFVKDKFDNKIAKSFEISCFEKQSLNLLMNNTLQEELLNHTTVCVKENKMCVEIKIKNCKDLRFAYYVQLEKQNIHKEPYSHKPSFELTLSEHGKYEVFIFCKDLLEEKFVFSNKFTY